MGRKLLAEAEAIMEAKKQRIITKTEEEMALSDIEFRRIVKKEVGYGVRRVTCLPLLNLHFHQPPKIFIERESISL